MADPVRTENPGDGARTEAGPGGVEKLSDLAVAIRGAEQGEQQQQQDQQQQQEREEALEAAGQLAAVLCEVRNAAADLAEGNGALPVGRTAEIWSDERIGKIATPLVLVLEKYGGNVGRLIEQFGPLGMLAFAVMSPTLETIREIRAVRAARPVQGGDA